MNGIAGYRRCLVCGRLCERRKQAIHPGRCRAKWNKFLRISFPRIGAR